MSLHEIDLVYIGPVPAIVKRLKSCHLFPFFLIRFNLVPILENLIWTNNEKEVSRVRSWFLLIFYFFKNKILSHVKLTLCHVVMTVSRDIDSVTCPCQVTCHYISLNLVSISLFCLNLVLIFFKIK